MLLSYYGKIAHKIIKLFSTVKHYIKMKFFVCISWNQKVFAVIPDKWLIKTVAEQFSVEQLIDKRRCWGR